MSKETYDYPDVNIKELEKVQQLAYADLQNLINRHSKKKAL